MQLQQWRDAITLSYCNTALDIKDNEFNVSFRLQLDATAAEAAAAMRLDESEVSGVRCVRA